MRLTCPNCRATYAIETELIPDGGRDVQCSACGHAWFFLPPGARTDPLPDPSDAAPPAPPRRAPDPDVMRILREEAARERAARGAGTDALQTQGDLGVAAPARRPVRPPPAAPPAALAEDAAVPVTPPLPARPAAELSKEPALPSRRHLLPEIEAAVGPAAAGDEHGPRGDAERGRGLRRGFALAILTASAALGVYIEAPRLAAALPQLAPALTGYRAVVDDGRVWLHERL